MQELNWQAFGFPLVAFLPAWKPAEGLQKALAERRLPFAETWDIETIAETTFLPLLDEWRDQKFMGRPAGIGEDRALTNLILREGWGVTMQRSALIYTNVPDTYLGITRMLLRWERSNIRENMEMYTFIFKDFRWDDRRRLFMLLTLLHYLLLGRLLLILLKKFRHSFTRLHKTGNRILSLNIFWVDHIIVLHLFHDLVKLTKAVCFIQ